MADKTLSTIVGGGGIFRTETFVHNQIIASGQTGDLVIIGTAGKVSRLTSLFADSSTAQGDMSIDVDGTIIVGPENLSDDSPVAGGTGFLVTSGIGSSSNVGGNASNILDVFGEFITIKKGAGNTTQPLNFSYETGSIS